MSYKLINWENSPSTKTPINAENLKHMDEGIAQAHDKVDELSIYKANSIITTSSGETFHETDCAAVPPVNIKLFGKGKQNTVPGNQLANFNDFVGTTEGYCFVREFKLLAGTMTFGIELDNNESGAHVDFVNDMGEIISSVGASKEGTTFQLTQEQVDSITQISLFVYQELVGNTIKSVMLNEGDVLKPYEPYVGGEQSPNMRYPQKAEFLGENGSIVGKVLTGNLFEPNAYLVNCNYDGDGIYSINSGASVFCVNAYQDSTPAQEIRIPNGDTTLSFEIEATNSYTIGNVFLCSLGDNNENYGFGVNKTVTNGVLKISKTITLVNDVKTIGLVVYGDTVEGLKIKNISLKRGSDDTYEPYTEQPFTALTPNGLGGIPVFSNGNYKDDNGQWWLGCYRDYKRGVDVKTYIELTFDGSEFWTNGYGSGDGVNNRFETNKTIKELGYKLLRNTSSECIAGAMCTAFVYELNTAIPSVNHFRCVMDDVRIYILFNPSTNMVSFENLDEWKTKLSDNPITVYLPLAEPIETPIPSDELESFNSLVMNYPNTTIVNGAGAHMEVEYVCDTQEHIKQNYTPNSVTEDILERLGNVESQIALNS